MAHLLSRGGNPNAGTAMFYGADSHLPELLRLLIDGGGDVNVFNDDLRPLFACLSAKGEAALEVMLAQPTLQISAKDKFGRTALECARNPRTVALLEGEVRGWRSFTHVPSPRWSFDNLLTLPARCCANVA